MPQKGRKETAAPTAIRGRFLPGPGHSVNLSRLGSDCSSVIRFLPCVERCIICLVRKMTTRSEHESPTGHQKYEISGIVVEKAAVWCGFFKCIALDGM